MGLKPALDASIPSPASYGAFASALGLRQAFQMHKKRPFVRLARGGLASAFLSFSTIRTLGCPPMGSLPKQQARGNVDAQWCRLSILDERWPPLSDPVAPGRVFRRTPRELSRPARPAR